MKTIIINSLKALVADRYLLVLVVSLTLLAIIFSVFIGLSIHSSERQLVSHYSAFGPTNFYKDQWFYMWSFVAFGIASAVLHSIIAVKLLLVKGHPVAIMFAWFGIGILLFAWVVALKLLGLRML